MCQIKCGWMNVMSYGMNLPDIAMKLTPLHSVCCFSSHELIFTLPAPSLAKVSLFPMMFILQLNHTADSAGRLKNK